MTPDTPHVSEIVFMPYLTQRVSNLLVKKSQTDLMMVPLNLFSRLRLIRPNPFSSFRCLNCCYSTV